MSNPGVITLAETVLGTGKNFRVEDNLAESIHFHYRDIRIDLTIRELEQIAEICDFSIKDLVKVDNFDLDKYNSEFLINHSAKFIELDCIKEELISIQNLYFTEKVFGCIPVYKKFSKRMAVKQSSNRSDFEMPVVFNNGMVLFSGVTQLAKEYLKNPMGVVRVQRFIFENEKYSAPKHPIIAYIFKWNKRRLKKLLWALAEKIF